MKKDAEGFVRSFFEDGMRLSAADLITLQDYFGVKRRLGYRSIIGDGIVFGLSVQIVSDSVTISPGLAIDCQGREIYLPVPVSIPVDALFSDKPKSGEYFLCIEYAEEPFGEAFVISEKKLRNPVHNRIRETFNVLANEVLVDGNICIAVIDIEAYEGKIETVFLKPYPHHFRYAPIWERFLPKHKFGLLYFDKDTFADDSGVFITEEIFHGFGCGKDVIVELSVKAYDKSRQCEIFGDFGLFGPQVRTAAKLFPESGTFVVAVKPRDLSDLPLLIRWHAYIAQEGAAYV